ncbi:hypothetical protein [Pengzhenrongella sp.]|uniref:hypothetical protein n=1 Tax=Pengzhenrongella sp. TaxID=2888820 RepID=UPI002F93FCF5
MQNDALEIDTLPGDIAGATATSQNIVLRKTPDGAAWTVDVQITAPIAAAGQKVGLILYSATSPSAKEYIFTGRIGRASSVLRRATQYQRKSMQRSLAPDWNELSAAGLPTTWWQRIVFDGRTYTCFDSLDGVTWAIVGRPVPVADSTYSHLGVYAATSATEVITATFHSMTLTTSPLAPAVRQPRPWVTTAGLALPETTTVGSKLLGILRGNTKYNVGEWWSTNWAGQDAQPYRTFTGVNEHSIRPAACAAFGITSLLFTGYWDASIGMSEALGRVKALRLAASLAYRHAANEPDGWGFQLQSGMWAALAGQAAWLQWHHLAEQDRQNVIRMVVAEADQPIMTEPQFWKDAAGVEVYPGDTKAEEMAWISMIWQLAVAMLPDHPHAPVWAQRVIEFHAAAWAKPADLKSTGVLHGQPVPGYLSGSNVSADGTLENHGRIHPDYMAAATLTLQSGILSALSDRPTPAAAVRNIGSVWAALSKVVFASGPYDAPGGTIYKPGSAALYYPEGNDWSTAGLSTRVMDKAAFDVMVSSFDLDGTVTPNAAAWADLHLGAVVALQARDSTGQVYQSVGEDKYLNPEQWISMNAAWAWLAQYVTGNQLYSVSNTSPLSYL